MRELILLIIYNVRYIKHLMRAPTFKTNECHYVLYIALFYSTKSRATLLNRIGVYIYITTYHRPTHSNNKRRL